MPKEYTHIHIAKKVLGELENRNCTPPVIFNNTELFLLGSVLPDTPAYLNSGKHKDLMAQIDRDFHDSPDGRFHGLLNILENSTENPDEMIALSMGTLCHIIADSVFHPMVYYYSGTDELSLHFKIETDLDLLFHRYGNFKDMQLRRLIDFTRINYNTVYEFLAIYFQNRIELTTVMKKAFIRQMRLQKLFTKTKTSGFLKLLNRFLKLGMEEYFNLFYSRKITEILQENYLKYKHPISGERMTDSIMELKNKSVEKTVQAILSLGDLSDMDTLKVRAKEMVLPNLLTGLKKTQLKEARHFSIKR